MINKRFKLKLRADDLFFSQSQKKRCGGLLLVYKKNESHFQTAVIITKRKIGQAHQRNQLKREIYNAIEYLLPQIQDWQLSLAIVIVNPQQVLKEEDIQEKLFVCLEQLGRTI